MMDAFRIPDLPISTIKTVDLSTAQIKAMSESELIAVLGGESKYEGIIPLPLQQIITSELLRRSLERTSKPHWSVTPSFWILIIGAAASCYSAYQAFSSQPQASQPSAVIVLPQQKAAPDQTSPPKLPSSSVNSSSHIESPQKK